MKDRNKEREGDKRGRRDRGTQRGNNNEKKRRRRRRRRRRKGSGRKRIG